MKLAQTQEVPFKKITGPTTNIDPSVGGVEDIITAVIGFLTMIGGILFVIWFMIGAYNWITAEGKPEKLEKARNHITQAIIGLVILVAAYSIVGVVGTILGFENIFDLSTTVCNIKTSIGAPCSPTL